jgi:transcriptional regulator with XRE-family HTH domain
LPVANLGLSFPGEPGELGLRLRETARYTGDQVAAALHWSASKVSRIESASVRVRPADLQLLLDHYEVTGSRRAELEELARQSARPGSQDDAALASYLPGYATDVDAETRALAIREWEPQVVPGLLQTADYARAVMGGWHEMFRLPAAELETKVEFRLGRQRLLRQPEPPALLVVLDQSVLHRRIGDDSVMREELAYLLDQAAIPNIDIRILPLDGAHPVGTGSFRHMVFGPESLPRDVVTTEDLTGNHLIDDVMATNQYRIAFEQLLAGTLDQPSSAELIARALREVWS